MVKHNIDTKTIIVISDDDDEHMIGKRKTRDDETNRPQTYKRSKNGQLPFPNGNGRKIKIEETSCHPCISTSSCPTRSKKTNMARNQPCSSTASSGPSTSQPLHSQSSCERLGTSKNAKRKKKRKNKLKGKDPMPRQHKKKKDKSTPPGQHLAGSSSATTMPQELTPNGEKFEKFSHIIFVDLDNWGRFFDLTNLLPNVFVWGFCGGGYTFTTKAQKQPLYKRLVQEGRFVRHPKCGKSKNAADFALCVQAARLDLVLPVHIPFTVLSGDKGFNELQMQLSSSTREIHLVDPHEKGAELLMAILNSIEQQ